MSIAVFGAGSWGTAIAIAIANNGAKVKLWGRDTKVINEVVNYQENTKYLPNCKIPNNVFASCDMEKVIRDSSILIVAVPTQSLNKLCLMLKEYELLLKDVKVVICSKGIDRKSLMFPSEIVEEIFKDNNILVLSGPSFAKEVAKLLPCSLTLAGRDKKIGNSIIERINSKNFKISYSGDMIGIQIAAALKNVIAIACGIICGRGLGNNALATVVTYGIREIRKLYMVKKGCDINFETTVDPACLGDLILTCTNKYSRNMFFGLEVGRGINIADLLKKNNVVIEGVNTVKSLFDLSNVLNVSLPLCNAVYHLIYENFSLDSVISKILNSY